MDALVVLVALGALVGVWFWLARRMRNKGSGWFIRHLAGSFAGSFAFMLLVMVAVGTGLISAEPKEDLSATVSEEPAPAQAEVAAEAVAESKAVIEQAAAAPVKTLGITPDQYAARLNELFQDAKLPHRINASNVVTGEVNDVLQAAIGKHTALVATVSKSNGEVMSVTVIGSGDGSERSGLEIMMVASAALTAATDDVAFREVFQGLPAMIKGQGRTYGAVKLSVMPMNEMGTWFIAEPI
jgi:hypothetical protein